MFVLKFYPKMQFSDPNDDNSTGTETKEYKHSTLEGTGYPNDENELKIEQEFDTLQEAQEALDELLKAATEPTE